LASRQFDRTEVDMRFGALLVEAKLTESDFQTREAAIVEAYRDFEVVFERELLPRVEMPPKRRKARTEFPEDYSQEFESFVDEEAAALGLLPEPQIAAKPGATAADAIDVAEPGYASYQLIRNVLAAHAAQCSFCVLHDERRPDLREEWFRVMAAVKSADLRTRLKVLTWQELAAALPDDLQEFLDVKYGIAAPGKTVSPVEDIPDFGT
jgi:hypothetical protein